MVTSKVSNNRTSTSTTQPWIITDVDNTILDTRTRVKLSLQEIGRGELYDKTKNSYGGFEQYLDEAELETFWSICLSDQYIATDEPEPYASEVLSHLVAGGLNLLYLTGRHQSDPNSMREGTKQWLHVHQFPIPDEESVRLKMKPKMDMNDWSFKQQTLREFVSNKDVIAGVGDLPQDAQVYQQFNIPPIIVTWLGLIDVSEIKETGTDIELAQDWREIHHLIDEIWR